MSKYHNNKVEINGIKFDSKKEAEHYLYLKSLLKEGKIKDLKLQTRFELQPSFKLNNKTIRAISYIADFVYWDISKNEMIIEDIKGSKNTITEVFKLKKKLFEYKYGIEIKIIM